MYIDDDDLAVALGATLGLLKSDGTSPIAAAADLPANLQTIVASANADAYGDILSVLINDRGLTKAQADSWRDGAKFQRSIGQYLAILEYNGLEGIAQGTSATWGYLDRRKELATVGLLDSDFEPIAPDTSGSIGYGRLNTDDDFNVPDLTDPRRGRYTDRTRW